MKMQRSKIEHSSTLCREETARKQNGTRTGPPLKCFTLVKTTSGVGILHHWRVEAPRQEHGKWVIHVLCSGGTVSFLKPFHMRMRKKGQSVTSWCACVHTDSSWWFMSFAWQHSVGCLLIVGWLHVGYHVGEEYVIVWNLKSTGQVQRVPCGSCVSVCILSVFLVQLFLSFELSCFFVCFFFVLQIHHQLQTLFHLGSMCCFF